MGLQLGWEPVGLLGACNICIPVVIMVVHPQSYLFVWFSASMFYFTING